MTNISIGMGMVGVRSYTRFKHSQLVESVTLYDGTRYEIPVRLDAQARTGAPPTVVDAENWHGQLVVQTGQGQALPADARKQDAYANLNAWLERRQVNVEWLTALGFERVIEPKSG